MQEKTLVETTEALCINTNRVYDWIIEESSSSATIAADSLPITLPIGATNISVTCTLTNSEGMPLSANAELPVLESAPRENHQFRVDGAMITLQRVTFTKNVYVVLEISGVDPETGGQFLITSDPVQFTFMETNFLCAPPGTSLVVRVSDFSCLTIINRDETSAIIGFQINASICQSIQMVSPVTVEVRANVCGPREAIIEHCGNVRIPPRCPGIFPRDHIQ